jgi:glutamate racemase
VALEIVQKNYKVPVIGVIKPGAVRACYVTRNKRVGVIGTSLTIYSGAYEKVFKKLDPECEILGRACPLFVPLVEEGWLEHPATELIVRSYLTPLKNDNIDTLLLGCTHFPLLMKMFRKVMGEIEYVDASREVVLEFAEQLKNNDLLRHERGGELSIYLTDLSMNFKEIGERFLGEPMKNFARVSLPPKMVKDDT